MVLKAVGLKFDADVPRDTPAITLWKFFSTRGHFQHHVTPTFSMFDCPRMIVVCAF